MSIDVVQTQNFYKTIKQEDLCNCIYCKFCMENIKKENKKLAEYMDSIGVSIEKPFEIALPYINEEGLLEYPFAQYIVFGQCEENFQKFIGEVEIRYCDTHPSTNIQEEHFVIEISPLVFAKDLLTDELISELE